MKYLPIILLLILPLGFNSCKKKADIITLETSLILKGGGKKKAGGKMSDEKRQKLKEQREQQKERGATATSESKSLNSKERKKDKLITKYEKYGGVK